MKAKDRVTLVLACNATRTHKVPVAIIGTAQVPLCFKRPRLPCPLPYFNQNSAWMDADVCEKWFKAVFAPAVRARTSLPVALVVDNCGAHSKLEHAQVTTIPLPPNVTSIQQPAVGAAATAAAAGPAATAAAPASGAWAAAATETRETGGGWLRLWGGLRRTPPTSRRRPPEDDDGMDDPPTIPASRKEKTLVRSVHCMTEEVRDLEILGGGKSVGQDNREGEHSNE